MNAMKTNPGTRTALFVSALLFFPAVGCGVSVEADIPDVEVTQRGLTFDGVPNATIDTSMTKSYSQQHGKLDLPDGLDSEVKTLSATLRATAGVDDLSFIQHLRITMAPDGGGQPIELGTYAPAGTPAGKELTLTTLNPVNVLDAWKTESAIFTVEIAGTLPSTSWTADVIVHFAGSARYKY